jgi:adenosylhomocysteine nucleosidase
MEKNPVIGIVMATMGEAKPFVEGLSLMRIERDPFQVFLKDNIVLVISGIGKANAAMGAMYCCHKYKPGLLCNLGAAGATDLKSSVGDIYHITEVVEYDRPEFKSGRAFVHNPMVLDGFRTAKVATQDRAVISHEKRKEVSQYAGLCDMEAASVVQACRKFRIECIVFKFVSDTPDYNKSNDIMHYIKKYRRAFFEFFEEEVLPVIT